MAMIGIHELRDLNKCAVFAGRGGAGRKRGHAFRESEFERRQLNNVIELIDLREAYFNGEEKKCKEFIKRGSQ
jgi:hypothetical protein